MHSPLVLRSGVGRVVEGGVQRMERNGEDRIRQIKWGGIGQSSRMRNEGYRSGKMKKGGIDRTRGGEGRDQNCFT